MNSYLQTLFYLPLVRAAVYNIPISAEQMLNLAGDQLNAAYSTSLNHLTLPSSTSLSSRSPSPLLSNGVDPSMTNIAAALQMLMYRMQTSVRSIDTKSLTQAFGWGGAEAFQQHDVRNIHTTSRGGER